MKKNNPILLAIGADDDGDEPEAEAAEESESYGGKTEAAQELIDAIEADDAEAVASAVSALMHLCALEDEE
jgi:hypothetical protein